jgi:hypothetical protein
MKWHFGAMEKIASIAICILLLVGVEWAAVEYKRSKHEVPEGDPGCSPSLESELPQTTVRQIATSNQTTMVEMIETSQQ